MRVLITGVAGFIGMHTAKRLLKDGHFVNGIDNLNDYYDVELKKSRLDELKKHQNFSFLKGSIDDLTFLSSSFSKFTPDIVINLAAQAGVRYSIDNPNSYISSNLVGFGNILECSREFQIKHLVYASSSSVYGLNKQMPFDERQNVDHPLALYGATKKANELMAHCYSHLFGIPSTGLRFFTVYGPWGRPDMALFKFTKAILEGDSIKVFNRGEMMRDFTYIDDIVEGITRVAKKAPFRESDMPLDDFNGGTSSAPWRIFNIGRGEPVPLMAFIEALEEEIGKRADLVFAEMQPGDVKETYANTDELERWIGWRPTTNVKDGIKLFVDWYRAYYSDPNRNED